VWARERPIDGGCTATVPSSRIEQGVDPELSTDVAANEGSHLALYRRWRAQTFSRIVGQDAVVTTLRNAVRTGQVAHALLFVGPRGTGKTSMARIVAKALNCTNLQDGDPCDTCPSCVAIREGRTLDVVELDAATNNKVDQIRELVERTWTAPSDLRRKVFVIDEVQRIDQGWDVLLKTLEEPPDHVVFIFCTTDPTKIRPAVLSRVQRFEFRRLTVPQIEGKLSTILAADGRSADPDAIALIARQAAGGMRDAESMLDQLLASTADQLTVEAVRDLLGLVDGEVIAAFLEALVQGDALAGIAVLDGLDETGRDLGAFVDQLVVALRGALAAALTGGSPGATTSGVGALSDAGRRIAAMDPSRSGVGGLRFQLELALIGAAAGPAPVARATPDARRPQVADRPATAASTPSEASTPADPPRPTRRASVDGPIEVTITAATPEPEAAPEREAASAPATPTDPSDRVAAASPDDPTTPRPSRPKSPAEPEGNASPGTRGDRPRASEPGSTGPRATEPGSAGPRATEPQDAAPRATEPIAVEPSATPPIGSDEAFQTLAAAWPAIVDELSKSPAIKPLITACRPLAVDGNVLTLGYPEGQSFLRDHLERRRPTLEEGIGRVIGRSVGVRLEATNLDVLPPPVDEEAERLLVAARRIFADDLVDAGEVG